MKTSTLVVGVVLTAAALAGCTPAGTGAVVGGATGAAIGGAATRSWGGAAVGAGVGAVTGAIIADAASNRCYWVDRYGNRHYVACR